MIPDATVNESRDDGPVSVDRPGHLAWLTATLAVSGWAYVDIWTANRASLPDFFLIHFVAWSSVFFSVGLAVSIAVYRLGHEPGRWNRAYATGFLAVLGIQGWGLASDILSRLSATLGLGPAAIVLGFGFAVAAWLFVRASTRGPLGRAIAIVTAAFLVGYPYLVVAQSGLSRVLGGDGTQSAKPVVVGADESARDVLVLVLDGYGSGEVLSERFGYDNTDFERRLADHHIEIAEHAKATYSLTALSIAGLLDGRYPALGLEDDATIRDLQRFHSGENALFARLKASGYELHMFDNSWTFTRCGDAIDVCHRAAFNELDHAVLARTPAFDLFRRLRISPWIRGSVGQLRDATKLAAEQSEAPRLIYLHALIPHEPFQLDGDCNERWDPTLSRYDLSSTEDVPGRAYVEQVQCVNDLVVEFVDALPDDAVIVITGDHGPRWAGPDPARGDATDLQVLTRFGVLMAYRFPESCAGIPDDVSLMGVSSALFDCLEVPIVVESERDPRQPPRYFSYGELGARIEVIDVTERVRALR